jgi:hypothetical protein
MSRYAAVLMMSHCPALFSPKVVGAHQPDGPNGRYKNYKSRSRHELVDRGSMAKWPIYCFKDSPSACDDKSGSMARWKITPGCVCWEALWAASRREATSYIATTEEPYALFTWLISRTFSANKQYFPLITNQRTVLSTMAFQPSEQGVVLNC